MNKKQKKGISLLVLVITIIVIIILARVVVLCLSNSTPITQANKVAFMTDLDDFQTELELYKKKEYKDKSGMYNAARLQADETSITYDGIVDTSKTINDLIPALGKTTKYAGEFLVVDGKLVYQGSDTDRQEWSKKAGIELAVAGEPTVTIISPADTVVKQGTNIVYTIKFKSSVSLTTIDLTGKVEVLDDNDIALVSQPIITIGAVSGTNADKIRQSDVTIATTTLENGTYKLKIKSGVVTNSNNMSNSQDTISSPGFDIDDIAPTNPVMSANPVTATNGNVDVTITYSADTTIKEYSFDTTTWQTYTAPVTVTDNGITVYARGKDIVGNESGVATLTVNNIDKDSPTNPVMVANPSTATNGNVDVTITYSADSIIKEYSFDTTTWQTYTAPVTVTDNCTVYARRKRYSRK